MPTFKAVQRLHRIKKDGTAEIQIRVTHERKVTYVRTGHYVKPKHLKNGEVVNHSDAALLNLKIEDKISEIRKGILRQELLHETINVSKATGKRPESSETMWGAVKHVLKKYEAQNQPSAYYRMKTNLTYIQEAWGRDKYIDDITKIDVELYANYRFQKGNTASTVKKNLKDLATVLNHIDYKGYNHFKAYAKSIKAKPVKREKLTAGDILRLEQVKLKGMADIARDMYLFSFYIHGARFENVATFKREYIKGNVIQYQMNKGGDHREISIHPKLKAIINKYINAETLYLFPVVKKVHNDWNKKEILGSANTMINNFLINAAQQAGIETHVHFHQARHTFAYLSKKKMVHQSVIQDALGHSKASTTQGYLKSLDDDYINDALKGLYE